MSEKIGDHFQEAANPPTLWILSLPWQLCCVSCELSVLQNTHEPQWPPYFSTDTLKMC